MGGEVDSVVAVVVGLAGWGVGVRGEEGEHFFVDVDAQGAGGEDVGADMEFVMT